MKLRLFLLAALLAFGTALAQSNNVAVDTDLNDEHYPSVTQTVTVDIPERIAIHVPSRYMNLSLPLDGPFANGVAGSFDCFVVPQYIETLTDTEFAGSSVADVTAALSGLNSDLQYGSYEDMFGLTAQDELYAFLVSEALQTLGETPASFPAIGQDNGIDGKFIPATGYPGIAVADHTLYKGGLFCLGAKLVQRFVNIDNAHLRWKLEAESDYSGEKIGAELGKPTDIGHIILATPDLNLSQGSANDFFGLDLAGSGDSGTLQSVANATHGWQDQIVYEGFFFDGSERSGSYTVTIEFTLAKVN